jgi:hypothetical protein
MLKQVSLNQIFQLEGGAKPVSLQFSLSDREAGFVNEVGVFLVDDDLGTIGGVAPGTPGYLFAFEDLFGGGDLDYNDLVIQLSFPTPDPDPDPDPDQTQIQIQIPMKFRVRHGTILMVTVCETLVNLDWQAGLSFSTKTRMVSLTLVRYPPRRMLMAIMYSRI